MLRAIFFTVFLLFVGQVTGAMPALATTEACGDTCPDEEREQRCPPSCAHCACGVQAAVEVAAVPLLPARTAPEAPPGDRPRPRPATAPPPPDPREILRVPR